MIRILVCLQLWLTFAADAEEVPMNPAWEQEKGISTGQIIRDSASPDRKWALFEFHHFDGDITTITGIAIAPQDHSRVLYVIDSRTKWMTDLEVPTFLTWRWNASSTQLATHDSGLKNSSMDLYRLKGEKAVRVTLPDILGFATRQAGLGPDKISSSAQIPVRWIDDETLEILVRMKTKAGTIKKTSLLLNSSTGTLRPRP